MQFKYAKELKKIYSVKGYYYKLQTSGGTHDCRNILSIQKSDTDFDPDLLVIMMNPGSSEPKHDEGCREVKNIKGLVGISKSDLVDAKPDPTQYQIMRIMSEFGFNHATILNLYDIRNTSSKEFLFEKHPEETSIFSDVRKEELQKHLKNNMPVILACGKVDPIQDKVIAAERVLKKAGARVYFSKGESGYYKHPSPPNQKLKQLWLDELYESIAKNKTLF